MSIYALGTAHTVEQLLESGRDYPSESVCLNPFCTKPVSYAVHHAGRRQLFCSPRCRLQYRDYRNHLTAERTQLVSHIKSCEVPRRTKVILGRQLNQLDWSLVLFPPTDWVKQFD